MDRIRNANAAPAALLCTAALMLVPCDASGQVRTDTPDRGVYRSPQLSRSGQPPRPSPSTSPGEAASRQPGEAASEQRDGGQAKRHDTIEQRRVAIPGRGSGAERDTEPKPRSRYDSSLEGLVDAEIPSADSKRAAPPAPTARQRRTRTAASAPPSRHEPPRQQAATDEATPDEATTERGEATHRRSPARPQLNLVSHDDVVLVPPHRSDVVGPERVIAEAPRWDDGGAVHLQRAPLPEGTACDAAGGGAVACDALGCDSPGCGRCDPCWWTPLSNGAICFSPDRWFGSAELLLMFRNGDHLPPLVTTGPGNDAGTAGELGQAETQVLAGDDKQLDGMTAGARLTLGTWLDEQQCRSLVLRGWMAGEETFGFHTNQNETPVIARPFFNVSDDQAPEQDTQLVAFPDRSSGSIDVHADSNVYGGDVSVRQFWYGRYGATVDFLYGYQYMRLDEDLRISSTSTSLDEDIAPLGSVLSITDSFDTENQFHGGQLGIASHYREGCWSFDGLLKFGFGSLRREAERRGLTRTSVDAATATTDEGLLVRSTNRGSTTDHTFGWIPELDLSLGWHRYPRFDVTCGYHIIAMTDALQVSGAIDRDLAVNLSDPPSGNQRPTAGLRYDTFYVHGIHFGLKYAY